MGGGQEVVFTYLRSKLSSVLEEADADQSSPSQIISRFRSIECQINFICESSSSSPPPLVDLLYKLIDVLSDCRIYAHQRRKSASASNNGFFRSLSKKKIGNQLDAIVKKLETISPISTQPTQVVIQQQTCPARDNLDSSSRIKQFESEAGKIVALLIKGEEKGGGEEDINEEEEDEAYGITGIGIAGMCGCGKTALAQKVFSSSEIQDEFFPKIWVCLSGLLLDDDQGVDKRVTVLKYILEQMSHDISELDCAGSNVIKLLEKLHLGLMGKRYLIVLDDAWRFDEFYADLSNGLPRGYAPTAELLSYGLPKWSGGGIILTSRSENVITRTVGGNRLIRLKPQLSHETCLDIFDSLVRDPILETRKDDLVRSCDGLPLAVINLAIIISMSTEPSPLPPTVWPKNNSMPEDPSSLQNQLPISTKLSSGPMSTKSSSGTTREDPSSLQNQLPISTKSSSGTTREDPSSLQNQLPISTKSSSGTTTEDPSTLQNQLPTSTKSSSGTTREDPSSLHNQLPISTKSSSGTTRGRPLVRAGRDSTRLLFESSGRSSSPSKISATGHSRSLSVPVQARGQEFFKYIPEILVPHVESCQDVKRDGNCGFRCIAHVVKGNEEVWFDVRNELRNHMDDHLPRYKELFGADHAHHLMRSLDYSSKTPAPKDKWMNSELGIVIATCYSAVVLEISTKQNQNQTHLPLFFPIGVSQISHEMAILYIEQQQHFVLVNVTRDCPIPPYEVLWTTHKTNSVGYLEQLLDKRRTLWNPPNIISGM